MSLVDQDMLFTFDVRQVSLPAFGVDMDHSIIACNDAALKLFGFSAAEAQGARCCYLIGPCLQDGHGGKACCRAVANARRGRHAPRRQVVITTPGGTAKRVELSSLIARSLDGKKCVLHFVRDVTEQHRVGEAVTNGLSQFQAAADSGARHPLPALGDPATPPPLLQLLTPREREVLSLLACGLDTQTIASTLSISPITARNHVTRLMEKLGATTRLQAVLTATRLHLL